MRRKVEDERRVGSEKATRGQSSLFFLILFLCRWPPKPLKASPVIWYNPPILEEADEERR
jgi:hypothetical protein